MKNVHNDAVGVGKGVPEDVLPTAAEVDMVQEGIVLACDLVVVGRHFDCRPSNHLGEEQEGSVAACKLDDGNPEEVEDMADEHGLPSAPLLKRLSPKSVPDGR